MSKKFLTILTGIAVVISIFLAFYLFAINTTEISWSLEAKKYATIGIITFVTLKWVIIIVLWKLNRKQKL